MSVPNQFEWFTGNIDRARVTDVYENADLMSGQVWKEFTDAIAAAGAEMMRPDIPGDPVSRASAFRHLMVLLGTGINQMLMTSSPYNPSIKRLVRTDIFKWGLDCPDCVYRSTEVRGDLTYRLTGKVEKACYLGFQINRGMAAIGNTRIDAMHIEPDGSFELWVGPNEMPGNWLRSTPDCNMLITRQFFGDWDNEILIPLSIELAPGQNLPNPLPDLDTATPDRVAQQIRAFGKWLVANAKFWNDAELDGQRKYPNSFEAPSVKTASGGAAENCNAWGHFNLEPGQAMIIEVEPVPCLYWSLHVGNFWWESLEYAEHHTSINHHQAQIDDDGVCRMVLSPIDPGVPNWLDTLNHPSGPLLFRWVVSQSQPNAAKTTVVPIEDVHKYLHPNTPKMSAQQRAAVIAGRHAAVLKRFQLV